jgi:hypothetical protein
MKDKGTPSNPHSEEIAYGDKGCSGWGYENPPPLHPHLPPPTWKITPTSGIFPYGDKGLRGFP